jgi:hypothetical protein
MIHITNPLEQENWNSELLSHEDYSFFHTATWANILHESYGYTPLYFTINDENRSTAMIPFTEVNSPLTGKRGVSLPFTDYCEPIVSHIDQCEEIFNYVTDYGKKNGWKYIEMRGGQKFFDKHESSEYYFGHTLGLTEGIKKISSKFRDSTKRNIKKALKEEVKVEITYSLKALNEVIRLNALTRREHGLPSQPYHFFKKIYDEIILKHKGFISLAIYKNTAVAGNMYFCHGKNVIFKYGASDRIYHHLRPNNLVMWEAIKWCCENGYKYLCFGKTEPDNDGLRQFKTGWGTEESIIKYYRYDLRRNSFVKTAPLVLDFQHKIFNKLPIPLLNALGTLLYKHMG